jgi:hypothetical protein
MTAMVDAARLWLMCVTSAWISLGKIAPIDRSPIAG